MGTSTSKSTFTEVEPIIELTGFSQSQTFDDDIDVYSRSSQTQFWPRATRRDRERGDLSLITATEH